MPPLTIEVCWASYIRVDRLSFEKPLRRSWKEYCRTRVLRVSDCFLQLKMWNIGYLWDFKVSNFRRMDMREEFRIHHSIFFIRGHNTDAGYGVSVAGGAYLIMWAYTHLQKILLDLTPHTCQGTNASHISISTVYYEDFYPHRLDCL